MILKINKIPEFRGVITENNIEGKPIVPVKSSVNHIGGKNKQITSV